VKLTNFTRKIWVTFASTADKRADYLWKLYLAHSNKSSEVNRYLDIGCGSGLNAIIFGQNCHSIHCLDIGMEGLITCKQIFRARGINKASFYQGDVQALPFKDVTFDRVSIISVIEHVANQHRAMQEISRILKPGGELILQVPNKYFFVDLHTGIPLLHLMPSRMRCWLLAKLGYKGLADVMSIQVPSKGKLNKLIRAEFAKVQVLKVVYPSELIVPRLNPIYSTLNLLGLFKLVPFGFLFIADKAEARGGGLNRGANENPSGMPQILSRCWWR
jgi:ubiquinone/menaquinone biosynthesis C-methylase UbiE